MAFWHKNYWTGPNVWQCCIQALDDRQRTTAVPWPEPSLQQLSAWGRFPDASTKRWNPRRVQLSCWAEKAKIRVWSYKPNGTCGASARQEGVTQGACKVYVGVHLFARAEVTKYNKPGWSHTTETYSPQFWWPEVWDQGDRALVSSKGSGRESAPPPPLVSGCCQLFTFLGF